MKLCGLQKTTLLDYPGHVAATIFLGGCNFRCPFCHNSGLIGSDAKPLFSEEEIIKFSYKEKGNPGRCLHYRRRTYTLRRA